MVTDSLVHPNTQLVGSVLEPIFRWNKSLLFASASYWEIIQWDSSVSGGREGGISAFISQFCLSFVTVVSLF